MTRRRRHHHRVLLAGAQALVLVAALLSVGLRAGTAASSPAQASAARGDPAVATFLARYVAADGRVIRHDQGGDVVSEGEAYAMVLSELAGRADLVRTVWSWTRAHLRRGDGLLAWHADGSGRVLDPQPAADADTLVAYALLGYQGPEASTLHRDGRRLAQAVLAHETVYRGGTAWVLAAGEWAMSPPATVDPSYLMPPVFRALAGQTGDGRWRALADSSVRLVEGLTGGGRTLPPDWARVDGNRLVPTGGPMGGAPAAYGPDAARVPVWFAADPSATGRRLAARWRTLVQGPVHVAALSLGLDGSVRNPARAPLSLVASAAMAAAAGDRAGAGRLLAAARAQAQAAPTYYGDAWAALGDTLLGGSWRVGATYSSSSSP